MGYNFAVTLVDSSSSSGSFLSGIAGASAGFSEISGLESKFDVEEFKEGGRNDTILKFPTRGNPSNLTLKRGIARTDELWSWHEGFLEGRGRRKDGIVLLLDDERSVVRIWAFRRGLPIKWTGPSLKASSNEVAIESLEIVHEGVRAVPI
jgi:phage tail-like protein